MFNHYIHLNLKAIASDSSLTIQGRSKQFIPSISFINGFRGNKSGWEFGFGPTFKIVKVGRGYYAKQEGGDRKWHLSSEWDQTDATGNPIPNSPYFENPNDEIDLPDRRGVVKLSTSLVIAVGKTFKSGYLNIPVNVYVVPNKKGTIVGISFGFNINKKPKRQ